MTTFAMGGWTSGTNLSTLLERAKIFAGVADYSHLGSTADLQNTRVAEYVNEAVQEYLQRNPALGLAEASISVVSGTQTYAIPTTLLGCQIEKLYFADSGSDSAYDCKPIPFVSPAQVQALPLEWINGTETANNPARWGLDKTGANIVFYPMPSATKTVTAQYRQEPTAITMANVATPAAVTIGEVPDVPASLKTLALHVAGGLCEVINASKSAELMGRFEAEIVKVQEELNRVLAAQRPDAISANDFGPINGGYQFAGMSKNR